jgi:hypothetical protein
VRSEHPLRCLSTATGTQGLKYWIQQQLTLPAAISTPPTLLFSAAGTAIFVLPRACVLTNTPWSGVVGTISVLALIARVSVLAFRTGVRPRASQMPPGTARSGSVSVAERTRTVIHPATILKTISSSHQLHRFYRPSSLCLCMAGLPQAHR